MKKSLFVHIPRTGGTSMEHAFTANVPSQVITRTRGRVNNKIFDANKTFTSFRHRLPMSLVKTGCPSIEWYNSCYKFAFVRNPWERLVSLYLWMCICRGRSIRAKTGSGIHLINFGAFIREVTNPNSLYFHPLCAANRSLMYAQRETYWLQESLDFIGRFETLQQDWSRLCANIGAPHIVLPHISKLNQDYIYREYYNRELRSLVAKDREEFIDRFKYTF